MKSPQKPFIFLVATYLLFLLAEFIIVQFVFDIENPTGATQQRRKLSYDHVLDVQITLNRKVQKVDEESKDILSDSRRLRIKRDSVFYFQRFKRRMIQIAQDLGRHMLLDVKKKWLEKSEQAAALPSPRFSNNETGSRNDGQQHRPYPHITAFNSNEYIIDNHLPLVQRRAVKDDRITYLLHLHKSAGTHMCLAARANNVRVAATNCNVQNDQRCCGNGDTFEAQRTFAAGTEFELVANERDMYSAMDTASYRYVVVLRDSRDRYISHWKNMCRQHNDTSTEFQDWWERQPDNWNTRKICGTRCMNVPKFQITEELFAYTLNRLRKFEDILFFERFNETYETFARHVGWSQTPTPSSLNHSAYSYPPIGSKHYAWEPHMTTLDDALFEYAVGLYEAEVQPPKISKLRVQRLQDYMAKGPMYMCTSPCCSAECSEY